MQEINTGDFLADLENKNQHFPLVGKIDLTYRCNLSCIHCYCKDSEDAAKELTTNQWKKILDEIQKAGCVWLTFSGGEPFLREDFLELYTYAKKKGFIITIFTNGQLLTNKIIDYLIKFAPFSIEITLNGATKDVYESITQVEGSFLQINTVLQMLKRKKLPFILKTNCLRQNKNQLGQIKKFAERLLGSSFPKGGYRFKYDPMIFPRLNGDKTPTRYRLSFQQLLQVRMQDSDIWNEYQRGLNCKISDLNFKRDRCFLYQCSAWLNQFFINPFGRLKFCQFSDKFSVDLKNTPFREGFYKVFPLLLQERYKTDSKCKNCQLRIICYHCPARSFLETGDEEAPVEYYCQLAEQTVKFIEKSKKESLPSFIPEH